MEEKIRAKGERSSLVQQGDSAEEPGLYRVVLFNDDYTTTDFVVEILVSIFHKSPTDAIGIVMDVHREGQGVVGVFSYDIGSTKVARALTLARKREFPLRCRLERA